MLIVSPEVAEALYGDTIPPDVIVTINAPDGWPIDGLWPSKVTVPGKPCWRCVATPLPGPLDHLSLLRGLAPWTI